METRKLVFLSAFLAITVFLNRISLHLPAGGVELVRVGIAGIPIVLSGLMFGPVAGGIVGALADIISFFLAPTGPYFPHFTMISALNGILPPLLLLNRRPPFSLPALVYSIVITRLVTHGILIPYFLHILLGAPYLTTLYAQLILQAVSIPIYIFVIKAFLAIFVQRTSGSAVALEK
ncbi:MAG: folate family ECF transporter S component [Candidatus Eremiobacteraeota bacterium]|nr:folate family ECF transporter S component [Candidatus Eremiobacteraeota bacterium]